MPKKILYGTAKNNKNELIHAKDSIKNQEYFCPGCGHRMIPRKSEKLLRRPYFAHKAKISSCTAESVLHLSFKELLYQKIRTHINTGAPFLIKWTCIHCNEPHTGNLIKKANDIRLEYSLDVCRPDIALVDDNGNVFAVIEIVVTHYPEDHAIKFYKENDIQLLIVELENEGHLDLINQTPFPLKKQYLCTTHPKCKKCKSYKQKKALLIMNSHCSRCKAKMKIAVADSNGHKSYHDFDEEDMKIARKFGVYLKKQYSKTVGYSYIANTCTRCGAFSGNYFLKDDYRNAKYGYLDYTEVNTGFYCDSCENTK